MHVRELRPYRTILKKPRNFAGSPESLVGDVDDHQDATLADSLAKHAPVDLDSSFSHLHDLNVHTSPETVFLYSILAESEPIYRDRRRLIWLCSAIGA